MAHGCIHALGRATRPAVSGDHQPSDRLHRLSFVIDLVSQLAPKIVQHIDTLVIIDNITAAGDTRRVRRDITLHDVALLDKGHRERVQEGRVG